VQLAGETLMLGPGPEAGDGPPLVVGVKWGFRCRTRNTCGSWVAFPWALLLVATAL